jgi:hypothetical protein
MIDINLYYVYLHRRADDNLPFWIGKGTKKRAWSTNRTKWWKHVANKHGYIVEIIQSNLSEKEAFELEIKMISEGKLKNWPLVNLTAGGEGVSGYKHTDETRKILSEKNKIKCSSGEGRKRMMEIGKIGGDACVKSGKLEYARSKIVGDPFAKSRCFETYSKGGKLGGVVSGNNNVKTGHIQKLGKIYGKWSVESGHLKKYSPLGGKVCCAKRWGIEKEPGLWISKKTGNVLLDTRNEAT